MIAALHLVADPHAVLERQKPVGTEPGKRRHLAVHLAVEQDAFIEEGAPEQCFANLIGFGADVPDIARKIGFALKWVVLHGFLLLLPGWPKGRLVRRMPYGWHETFG